MRYFTLLQMVHVLDLRVVSVSRTREGNCWYKLFMCHSKHVSFSRWNILVLLPEKFTFNTVAARAMTAKASSSCDKQSRTDWLKVSDPLYFWQTHNCIVLVGRQANDKNGGRTMHLCHFREELLHQDRAVASHKSPTAGYGPHSTAQHSTACTHCGNAWATPSNTNTSSHHC